MRLKDKVQIQKNEINRLLADKTSLVMELRTLIGISEVDQQIIEEQMKVIKSPEYMLDGMSKEERSKLLAKYCPNCYCKDAECNCIHEFDELNPFPIDRFNPILEAFQDDRADYLGGEDI